MPDRWSGLRSWRRYRRATTAFAALRSAPHDFPASAPHQTLRPTRQAKSSTASSHNNRIQNRPSPDSRKAENLGKCFPPGRGILFLMLVRSRSDRFCPENCPNIRTKCPKSIFCPDLALIFRTGIELYNIIRYISQLKLPYYPSCSRQKCPDTSKSQDNLQKDNLLTET